ncbi:MAG: thiol-disulfide oxidoreductase DCC family protein [Actinomycetota bacterium]
MPHSIVLYDGICGFCNRFVRFVIERDPGQRFRFASLQSPEGRALLQAHDLPEHRLDTFYLIENGLPYMRSEAALRIAGGLPFPWPLLGLLRVLPGRIRDFLYDRVASHRYAIFGQTGSCPLPDPALRERFLDQQ